MRLAVGAFASGHRKFRRGEIGVGSDVVPSENLAFICTVDVN